MDSSLYLYHTFHSSSTSPMSSYSDCLTAKKYHDGAPFLRVSLHRGARKSPNVGLCSPLLFLPHQQPYNSAAPPCLPQVIGKIIISIGFMKGKQILQIFPLLSDNIFTSYHAFLGQCSLPFTLDSRKGHEIGKP